MVDVVCLFVCLFVFCCVRHPQLHHHHHHHPTPKQPYLPKGINTPSSQPITQQQQQQQQHSPPTPFITMIIKALDLVLAKRKGRPLRALPLRAFCATGLLESDPWGAVEVMIATVCC
jgi:hypothetical protein